MKRCRSDIDSCKRSCEIDEAGREWVFVFYGGDRGNDFVFSRNVYEQIIEKDDEEKEVHKYEREKEEKRVVQIHEQTKSRVYLACSLYNNIQKYRTTILITNYYAFVHLFRRDRKRRLPG